MKTVSQNFFIRSKHVLYRPDNPFWGMALFFYRGLYFCNRKSYNVDTLQAQFTTVILTNKWMFGIQITRYILLNFSFLL